MKIENYKLKIDFGFTLIELMVAVTVSMLLVVGLTISVNGFFAKEKINQASSELISLLNLARNLAITNQLPTGVSSSLDYVAVTLTSSGKLEAFPVNVVNGIGTSYFSKQVASTQVTTTAISFGSLQFASNSGKLVGKNAAPSFVSYPLPSTTSVGITIASPETSTVSLLQINPFGVVTKIN